MRENGEDLTKANQANLRLKPNSFLRLDLGLRPSTKHDVFAASIVMPWTHRVSPDSAGFHFCSKCAPTGEITCKKLYRNGTSGNPVIGGLLEMKGTA